MRLALRVVGVVALGNALGWGMWHLALWVIPELWRGKVIGEENFLELLALTGLSFICLATPHVLIGALAGRLARRWPFLVGLACGLWSFSLVQTLPPGFPIGTSIWYVPTLLILASGAAGGWLMELHVMADEVGRQDARFKSQDSKNPS